VIDAGQLVVEIGIAPVKPAEFVIFQIAQFSGGTSLTE
jgi:phage tail sheath protein FI